MALVKPLATVAVMVWLVMGAFAQSRPMAHIIGVALPGNSFWQLRMSLTLRVFVGFFMAYLHDNIRPQTAVYPVD